MDSSFLKKLGNAGGKKDQSPSKKQIKEEYTQLEVNRFLKNLPLKDQCQASLQAVLQIHIGGEQEAQINLFMQCSRVVKYFCGIWNNGGGKIILNYDNDGTCSMLIDKITEKFRKEGRTLVEDQLLMNKIILNPLYDNTSVTIFVERHSKENDLLYFESNINNYQAQFSYIYTSDQQLKKLGKTDIALIKKHSHQKLKKSDLVIYYKKLFGILGSLKVDQKIDKEEFRQVKEVWIVWALKKDEKLLKHFENEMKEGSSCWKVMRPPIEFYQNTAHIYLFCRRDELKGSNFKEIKQSFKYFQDHKLKAVRVAKRLEWTKEQKKKNKNFEQLLNSALYYLLLRNRNIQSPLFHY